MPANPDTLELLEEFHARLEVIADNASRATAFMLPPAAAWTPDNELLPRLIAQWVRVAAAATTLYQRITRTQATAFFRTAALLETGQEFTPATDPAIGTTPQGIDMVRVYGATEAQIWVQLNQGRTYPQVARFAQFAASRSARTAVMDVVREEITQAVANSPAIGWRRVSRGTCGACMSADDGSIQGGDLDAHPNCRCIAEPVFDVEETVHRETGRERFEAMDEAEQTKILDPRIVNGLREGSVQWADLSSTVQLHGGRRIIRPTSLEAMGLETNAADGGT